VALWSTTTRHQPFIQSGRIQFAPVLFAWLKTWKLNQEGRSTQVECMWTILSSAPKRGKCEVLGVDPPKRTVLTRSPWFAGFCPRIVSITWSCRKLKPGAGSVQDTAVICPKQAISPRFRGSLANFPLERTWLFCDNPRLKSAWMSKITSPPLECGGPSLDGSTYSNRFNRGQFSERSGN